MADTAHAAGFPQPLVQAALQATAGAPGMQVLGISGLQGSGKSTLAAQVVQAATAAGLSAATVSLDDFYLTAAARRDLAARVHPLLATRGPPGTHDLALALETLDALRAGATVPLPRFDKLGDDRLPRRCWPRPARPLQLLVFEGWCLGVPAADPATLATPLNALEAEHDPACSWRQYCNTALARDYPALWARVDRLWFLQPPDFATVHHWRLQQEQALQAANPGRGGMGREALRRFVQHYERVSRQALHSLPALADTVVVLDAHRRVQAVIPAPA